MAALAGPQRPVDALPPQLKSRPLRASHKPFDANELARRLEEHRQQQKLDDARRKHASSLHDGKFVPRSAARQFRATTTPLDDRPTRTGTTAKVARPQPKSNSHILEWDARAVAYNPGQVLATHHQGLPESEIVPRRASETSKWARSSHPKQISGACQPSREGGCQRSLSTALETLAISSGPRRGPEDRRGSQEQSLHRPVMPYDRNDWAQQSQCGDDATRVFGMLVKKAQAPPPQERNAMASFTAPADRSGTGHRKRSHGDVPINLLSEATRRIKEEERARRRSSLLSVFKRHRTS
ncbi:hypothetical protein LTR66_003390 [Elasticomyces elasticus]|nr:hypothetical protein LTR50_004096 [Elasticomyces elasticus]KAK4997134.1 hypothetical protein LTR66_003390 [Elasticomyces elasticus]